MLSCCKREEPPCVPQKPTGNILIRNSYDRFSRSDPMFYMECDTCFEDVDFLVEGSNYKSITTKIGADPRIFGKSFSLRMPQIPGASYVVTATLRNWGDCGSQDTLVTTIKKRFTIGNYSMSRLHGTRYVGTYDDGRIDTIFIDTVTRANALCCDFKTGNFLNKFPLPTCYRARYYNSGTWIYNRGNTLIFGSSQGNYNYCTKMNGIGRFSDSTIELFADTIRGSKSGTVSFKGRRIR